METKNEFQGNKSIKKLQSKSFKNAMETFNGINALQHEELMQIKGGEYVGGILIPQDLD
jgi:hypothetical protein